MCRRQSIFIPGMPVFNRIYQKTNEQSMKYLMFLILFFPSTEPVKAPKVEAAGLRQYLVQNAEKYLGLKYRSKIGSTVLDCSGYVKHLMSEVGVKVTRSSVSQIHDGERIHDISQAQPGDILVFKGRSSKSRQPGHVGLVHHWANDTLYFIHSSVTKGITIDNLHDPYYSKRFLQVRNVLDNKS